MQPYVPVPSYFAWVAAAAAAAAADSQHEVMTWPPAPIPGRPLEPCGFDGFNMIPALFGALFGASGQATDDGGGGGSASPRTEVVHALINAHNPPNYPHSAMKSKGFPFSCAASSFCGGALRVGDYKLLVPHAAFVCVSEKFCTHWD